MAKANLTFLNGTRVTIEGTSKEVASLLEKFSAPIGEPVAAGGKARRSTSAKMKHPQGRKISQPSGPVGHIRDLKEEGFFKSKRAIGDIQKKLEEKGHIYALSSLSPALIRLVRSRVLGRLKESGVWKYVNR